MKIDLKLSNPQVAKLLSDTFQHLMIRQTQEMDPILREVVELLQGLKTDKLRLQKKNQLLGQLSLLFRMWLSDEVAQRMGGSYQMQEQLQ